jgi:UDP-N-acetylglucosamine--N-acetylmuramyl-(pentapeptide) pyrophosphoryl-undecaprenol N-acetylglucosamine transferase
MTPAADQITVTFQQSARAFPARKVLYTGNPVRPDILTGSVSTAREIFHLPEHSPVLLVIGGGTGSASMNAIVGATAHRLVEHWTVIHVTGPGRDFVELHSPHYLRYSFLTWQLPHALAAADLVVTRVGLGAFTELAALGKAAIFIPMPDSHQEDNAALITAAAAGMVIPQDAHLQSRLLEVIDHLRLHPEERQRLGQNLHQFYRADALPHLSDAVTHLMASS